MERVCNMALHRENMKAFDYALSLYRGGRPAVWAAWGAIIRKRAWLTDCVKDMVRIGEEYGARWFTCGARSKAEGHPHHPLYLRKDEKLAPFDAEAYLLSLK